jgi:PBSX family phage terminase large subunit
MSEANINLTKKQTVAWKLLMDDHTNIVTFGGSAGGGKSFVGTLWIATLCLKYAGIRTLIGRTVLQQLKMTTLNTLFETLQRMGLKSGEHYTYNGQSNIITFQNKSEIILKDLAFQPSDPNYDSLGGIEVSAVFIDEAAQVSHLCYSILKSRIRFKLNEYKLIPKVLLTCNPGQNWIKKDFYIPFVQETLDNDKAFVPSLPMDNPHLPPSYIEMLKGLPPSQRRRLLEGDWNYMEESDAIFDFDAITASIFKNVPDPTDKKYMSVDVARFGADRSVCVIWVGLTVVEIAVYSKLSTVELSSQIKELIAKHGIHPTNVIIDSDGVGGGVADQIRGTNFVNNAKPLHNENFGNLKSQCYIKLSELFKEGKISINIMSPSDIDDLTQELLAVKLKDVDKDNKVQVGSKDDMKRMLGKSPDLSDALMMRMYYEIKNKKATGQYSMAFLQRN